MTTTPAAPGLFEFLRELRFPTPPERAAFAACWRADAGFRTRALLGAALATAWTTAFGGTWRDLAARWSSDDNYSHGFFVPLVAIYLAARAVRRDGVPAAGRGGWFAGPALTLVGVLAGAVAAVFPSLAAESFALVATLGGLTLTVGGWGWARRLAAPILFLAFMAPWPSAAYSRVAFPLQLQVCALATGLLDLCGMTIIGEGTLIHLPKQTLHVAEACSGLRQLTAFLAIGACAALLVERPWWYRTILLLAAVPLAIAINVLRVALTCLVVQYGDPAWTQGAMHTVEGLAMVALGLAGMRLLCATLDWALAAPPLAPAPSSAFAAGGVS